MFTRIYYVSTFNAYIFANGDFGNPETLVAIWNKTQNDSKTIQDVASATEQNAMVYKMEAF